MDSLKKEWKFKGTIYCKGSGCEDFPQCSGAINKAVRDYNCEIELHGVIVEVKKDHPVKREIPVV